MATITKKSWDEFRETGLLLLLNQFLHIFGWSIVVEVDTKTKEVTGCYPARVKFRGFDEKSQDEAYTKITEYMKDNVEELSEEIKE